METANLNVKAEDLRVVEIVKGLSEWNSSKAEQIQSRVEARRALAPGEVFDVDSPLANGGSSVKPHGSTVHRTRFGGGGTASPRRVATWNPESLYE
jgi:hypothetical protein